MKASNDEQTLTMYLISLAPTRTICGPKNCHCHHLQSLLVVAHFQLERLILPQDADGELIGEITEDGQLLVGEHVYSSPDRAAHEHGSDAGDGWSYWLVHLGNEPIPLEVLREGAAAQSG